jgi:hypothetical protein
MNNKIKNILFIMLIFWQLLIWFLFVPSNYSDPMSPAGELAPLFYYLFGIPAGIWGIFLSFSIFKKNLELTKNEKIIAWILVTVSICTAIPPLFIIVRYVFYPLVTLLGKFS